MMDTLSTPNAPADEILRLKCPSCGGGLNLKRRFLGVKGQCVHCQIPLTAVEENGVARVVTEAPEPFAFPPASATHAAPPHFPEAPAPSPAPADTAPPLPDSTWGFPDFHSSPGSATAPIPASPAAETPSFRHFATPELAPPLPSREGDDLFMGKHDLPPATPPTGEAKAIPSPFGESSGFSLSSPLFGGEDPANSVTPAWGTSVPRENHASISPFATGSAEGGGYAESLFREKVVKDAAADAHEPVAFATPFATKMASALSPGMDAPSPALPAIDCQEFVILDGDGRPMKAMSKEEEEDFAKNFFKYDNARTKPTWVTRLRKKIIRMLVFFCVIGAIGAGASFLVPKETLLVWKEKAIKWLEPGMAILDYLPAGLRPDWLPQTDFGIDTGVDENGQPKKKMNAFEGLDKLKGDIGDMRGAADEQLEELKNF